MRNLNPRGGVLPNNPKWVFVDCSDGDASRWPTNTTSNPDAENHVNFMNPLPLDHEVSIKWRALIGQSLAEMLKYDDLESKSWVLHSWPAGYQFYDHNKGQLGSKNLRHDLYLVGSKLVARFRSPQEFIPHAYWLITDRGKDRNNCRCKYCARRPQREVSDAFGFATQHRGPSASQGARVPTNFDRAARRREKQREVPHVTVHRAPKMLRLTKGPSQFVAPERESELRGATGKKRQWARESELVWVKLDQSIVVKDAPAQSEDEIMFWPGIVEDIRLKPIIHHKEKHSIMKDVLNTVSSVAGAGNAENAGREDDLPWTVRHTWLYKVRLLVALGVVVCGDEKLLPYQSYAPSEGLLRSLRSVKVDIDIPPDEPPGMTILTAEGESAEEAEDQLLNAFARFNPFPSQVLQLSPSERTERCNTAAGPYMMAFDIAVRIARCWTPTHSWECRMMMPSAALPSAVGAPNASSSILSGNETRQPQMSGAGPTAEHATAGGQQLHHPAPKPSQDYNIEVQTRFQGLWWGPERIWMGDLVRLKVSRSHFAPSGAPNVKRPSGSESISQPQGSLDVFSAIDPIHNQINGPQDDQMQVSEPPPETTVGSANDLGEAMDEDPPDGSIQQELKNTDSDIIDLDGESDGAASRGLFMLIDSIFVARGTQGRGVGNECRLAGMLYELADEDWESEGEEVTPVVEKPTGKMIATPLTNLELSPSKRIHGDSALRATSSSPPPASIEVEMKHNMPQPLPEVNIAANPPVVSDLPPTIPVSGNGSDETSNNTSSAPRTNATLPVPTVAQLQAADARVDSDNSSKDGEINIIQSDTKSLKISTPPPKVLSEKAKGKQREVPLPSSTSQLFNPGNPSLSAPCSPLTPSYPLPPAPQTYKFRPILKPSFEAVVPLTLLSGRYYPGILQKPLMKPYVTAASQDPEARGNDAYWALECLDSGVFNSVDPVTKIAGRYEMVRRAEMEAKKELMDYWKRSQGTQTNDAIDVDAS